MVLLSISQFPIPLIDEILANITDTNFMFTLDLTLRYLQIPMKFQDTSKTTFITKKDCFTFKWMNFGLFGAPSMFQKAMNKILKPMLGKGVSVGLSRLYYRHAGYF